MVTEQLEKRADLAVAVSGVAGPGGDSADGCCFRLDAWQLGDNVRARHFLFSGDREAVRQATILEALSGCWPTIPNSKGILVSANILVVSTVKCCFNLSVCLYSVTPALGFIAHRTTALIKCIGLVGRGT